MATITKKQLVEKISNETGQTKVGTKESVQLFLDTIRKELEKGNRIELRDFGVFEVKKRASRVGRNPRTGDVVQVPTRNVVTFKVGRKMKRNVAKQKDLKDVKEPKSAKKATKEVKATKATKEVKATKATKSKTTKSKGKEKKK